MSAKTKTWTTKDGREIPLVEMADSHVINAVRFFRARATVIALLAAEPVTEPHAALKREQWSMTMRGVLRRLRVIEAEASRRGLDAAIRARVEGAT